MSKLTESKTLVLPMTSDQKKVHDQETKSVVGHKNSTQCLICHQSWCWDCVFQAAKRRIAPQSMCCGPCQPIKLAKAAKRAAQRL